MRWLALVALSGCRAILGIDGAVVDKQVDGGTADAPSHDGSHDDASDAAIDTPIVTDVHAIDCSTVAPAATVQTTDGMFHYNPESTTIAVGKTVKFRMSALHDVVPDPTNSDPGLAIGFGQTGCLVFTVARTYGYHCSSQGFSGTITVK